MKLMRRINVTFHTVAGSGWRFFRGKERHHFRIIMSSILCNLYLFDSSCSDVLNHFFLLCCAMVSVIEWHKDDQMSLYQCESEQLTFWWFISLFFLISIATNSLEMKSDLRRMQEATSHWRDKNIGACHNTLNNTISENHEPKTDLVAGESEPNEIWKRIYFIRR